MKELDEMDSEIIAWSNQNFNDLKDKLKELNVKHYKRSPSPVSLQKALKQTLKSHYRVTDQISYKMPRHAIFLHKGVSKGHPISNPRQAKEWYTPVVDKNIEKLQDIIADAGGNLVINSLNIK